MRTDATSANNSQHCCVLLANNVASVCMGLNVWPVSNYTQQVPTSANIVVVPCKRTQQVTTLLGATMLGVVGQHCWVRLHGPLHFASKSCYILRQKLLHFGLMLHFASKVAFCGVTSTNRSIWHDPLSDWLRNSFYSCTEKTWELKLISVKCCRHPLILHSL